MKPVKHLLASNGKSANVPDLTYKKGLLNLPLSPKSKEKHSAKTVHDRLEPMVLRSPPTGESIVRYALPIPSSKTKEFIAEDELVRKITKHLKMIVSSLEETYGFNIQNEEKPVMKPEHEGLSLSVGDELNGFLVYCSQSAAQLEEAAKEEYNILESLFKWFQRQVNQMEEISKDQTFSETEFPASDKTVSLSIAQIVKQVRKLEELKNRLKEGHKYTFKDLLSKPKVIQIPPEVQTYETIQQKIEEFITTHSTEEISDVFATEPQTTTMSNLLNALLKIFENQENKLERAMSEQVLLETKYTQIQNDLQVLSEEKLMLENELQKLKNTEKTKATGEQTKKTVKTEKKKDKGKSEHSEEKKSAKKELNVKESMLQVQKVTHALEVENQVLREQLKQALQEAERAKQQFGYFLNQERVLLKSEGKRKTTEIGTGKTEAEDSKYIPLEKEIEKALVADSSGQKANDKIKHPQILKSQDESPFLKSSNEALTDEDISYILSSKTNDKSIAAILLSKEIQDSQSVETLLQGNETVTAPSILPPVTKRKPLGTDISKARILENLRSKVETQTYQEIREFQAHGKELDEDLMLEDKAMSKAKQMLKQRTSRVNRRNAFLITQPNDKLSMEDQLPKDIALILKSQSKIKNLKATRSSSLDSYDDVSDENLLLNHQDSVSETQVQVEKQRTLKRGRPSGSADVSGKNLMLKHEDSKSETEMQVEKKKSSGDERLITSEENLSLEHQKSMSETQVQVKKQREKRLTEDEVPGETHILEHQDLVSRSEIEVKKQISQEGEKLTTRDGAPGQSPVIEYQDSMSKLQMQEQKQILSRGRKHSTHTGVPGENLTLVNQDSVSKPQMQVEKRTTYRKERRHSYYGVPDTNLMLVNQDLVSKPQTQVKKQVASREERRNTFPLENERNDTVRVETLPPEKKALFSRNQSQTKKFGATRKNLDTPKAEDILDENLLPDDEVELSKSQSQTKTLRAVKMETLNIKNGAASGHPSRAQNLSAVNPSITDLIFQLGLDKVVEMDLEHLKDTVGRHILMTEMRIQPKSLPDTNTEPYPDVTGRRILKGEMKTQSKRPPETDTEHRTDNGRRAKISGKIKAHLKSQPDADIQLFPDAIGRGFMKDEFKIQPMSHPNKNKNISGTNVEGSRDKTIRGVQKGQFKTQSMNLPDPDTDRLPDTIGIGILKREMMTLSKRPPETDTEHRTDNGRRAKISGKIKAHLKSQPGVNLLENKDMSIQHQTDFFTKRIIPGINLFKNKNTLSHQEDFYMRHNAASKYKTKVINLSPFESKDKPHVFLAPLMTEHPKALHRASRVHKTIHFPSLNKEHSVPGSVSRKTHHEGHQKNSTLNQKTRQT